jgi:ribose transport system permease protein
MTANENPQAATTFASAERREVEHGRLVSVLLTRQYTLTIVTVALFCLFSVFAPRFLTVANVFDMLRVISYTLVVAVPMTYLFIAGELDLSVGSNVALTMVVMAMLIATWGWDPWIAATAAIAVGGLIGVINAFVTTVIGVPSFIVTLGMLSLLRGLALVLTGATPIVYPDTVQGPFFNAVNSNIGWLDDLPIQVVWGLCVTIIGAFVLSYRRFGYHVYATGGNPRAARSSGISTRGVKAACFLLTGAACGLLGALEGGWLREGNPTSGAGFELQVIAALIIGGITLTGGAGSVYGTFLGAWVIAMLYNGLVLLGVPGNWNGFFVGLLIVLVASAEMGLKRRHELSRFLRVSVRDRLRRSLQPIGGR